MILSYLNIEGLSTIGSKIQDAGLNFDPTKYQFGIYGAIIVAMMLLAGGADTERRHRIELEEGVHDTRSTTSSTRHAHGPGPGND
jgi:hypothetical protein